MKVGILFEPNSDIAESKFPFCCQIADQDPSTASSAMISLHLPVTIKPSCTFRQESSDPIVSTTRTKRHRPSRNSNIRPCLPTPPITPMSLADLLELPQRQPTTTNRWWDLGLIRRDQTWTTSSAQRPIWIWPWWMKIMPADFKRVCNATNFRDLSKPPTSKSLNALRKCRLVRTWEHCKPRNVYPSGINTKSLKFQVSENCHQ